MNEDKDPRIKKITELRKKHREEMNALMEENGLGVCVYHRRMFKDNGYFDLEDKDDDFLKVPKKDNILYSRLIGQHAMERKRY